MRESKERVRAALAHCDFEFPAGRITVNLAPADLPKEGGRFDLPIALGILVASGQVPPPGDLARSEFYGELGLTGDLKPVPGLCLQHCTRQSCVMNCSCRYATSRRSPLAALHRSMACAICADFGNRQIRKRGMSMMKPIPPQGFQRPNWRLRWTSPMFAASGRRGARW